MYIFLILNFPFYQIFFCINSKKQFYELSIKNLKLFIIGFSINFSINLINALNIK